MAAPPTQHDAVYTKWLGWLNTIEGHIIEVHHHRQLWKELRAAIVEEVPESPGVFIDHYTKLYVDSQVMAVRRLVHVDKDSISLGRLIVDICNQPTVMTLDRYVSMHREDGDEAWPAGENYWRREASATFDEKWGDGSGLVSIAKLKADGDKLSIASDRVNSFATRRVAHIDRRTVEAPTFDELDDTINLVGQTFAFYALLLTAASWASLEPVIQGDWKATFRVPLFQPLDRSSRPPR